jgi:hypothetical protein
MHELTAAPDRDLQPVLLGAVRFFYLLLEAYFFHLACAI